MNAEIIDRLERSFGHWPQVTLPSALVEQAMRASADRREMYTERLNDAARALVMEIFPSGDIEFIDLISAFFNLLDGAPGKTVRDANGKLVELLRELAPFMRPEVQETLASMGAADDIIEGVRRDRSEAGATNNER